MPNVPSGFHTANRPSTAAPPSSQGAAAFDEIRTALRKLLPDAPTSLPIRLAGEIHVAGGICDVVALLAQSGRTGTLVVTSADATRSIAIERGELVGATTSTTSERLGEVLYRSGEISRDDIDEALMIGALDEKPFGRVLVELGRIDEAVLDFVLTRQAEEIFYAALRVDEGVFCFVDDQLAAARTAVSRPTVMSLMMEGARRMDEMLVYRALVPSGRHVPRRLVDATGSLPLDMAAVLDHCNGERSIAEIGREVGMLEFEVTQAMHGLMSRHLIEMSPPRIRGSEDMIALYNDVLVEVHRRCDRLRVGEDLRRALERYIVSSPDLLSLLEGIAPGDDGALDTAKVARNAGSARREVTIKRAIGQYVDFAVFHGSSLLPCGMAAELPALAARALSPIADVVPPSSATRGGSTLVAAVG